MFIDLDCRFDIVRLSQLLRHRLMASSGKMNPLYASKSILLNCILSLIYLKYILMNPTHFLCQSNIIFWKIVILKLLESLVIILLYLFKGFAACDGA